MIPYDNFETRTPASPTSSTACTLPFSVFSQSPDSTRLPHSLEKHRGYTPLRPISELIANTSAMQAHFGVRRFRAAFDQHRQTTTYPLAHAPNTSTTRSNFPRANNPPPFHAQFTLPRDPTYALPIPP